MGLATTNRVQNRRSLFGRTIQERLAMYSNMMNESSDVFQELQAPIISTPINGTTMNTFGLSNQNIEDMVEELNCSLRPPLNVREEE